jgi:hypothetical protein
MAIRAILAIQKMAIWSLKMAIRSPKMATMSEVACW